MIRETVISEWTGLKNQLQKVCLSPQEKECFSQLKNSKSFNFNPYSNQDDSEELNKEIWQEREHKLLELDTKNELLEYLQLACYYHSETILDWTRLKKEKSQAETDLAKSHERFVNKDFESQYFQKELETCQKEIEVKKKGWDNWINDNSKYFAFCHQCGSNYLDLVSPINGSRIYCDQNEPGGITDLKTSLRDLIYYWYCYKYQK